MSTSAVRPDRDPASGCGHRSGAGRDGDPGRNRRRYRDDPDRRGVLGHQRGIAPSTSGILRPGTGFSRSASRRSPLGDFGGGFIPMFAPFSGGFRPQYVVVYRYNSTTYRDSGRCGPEAVRIGRIPARTVSQHVRPRGERRYSRNADRHAGESRISRGREEPMR